MGVCHGVVTKGGDLGVLFVEVGVVQHCLVVVDEESRARVFDNFLVVGWLVCWTASTSFFGGSLVGFFRVVTAGRCEFFCNEGEAAVEVFYDGLHHCCELLCLSLLLEDLRVVGSNEFGCFGAKVFC